MEVRKRADDIAPTRESGRLIAAPTAVAHKCCMLKEDL